MGVQVTETIQKLSRGTEVWRVSSWLGWPSVPSEFVRLFVSFVLPEFSSHAISIFIADYKKDKEQTGARARSKAEEKKTEAEGKEEDGDSVPGVDEDDDEEVEEEQEDEQDKEEKTMPPKTQKKKATPSTPSKKPKAKTVPVQDVDGDTNDVTKLISLLAIVNHFEYNIMKNYARIILHWTDPDSEQLFRGVSSRDPCQHDRVGYQTKDF